MSNLLSSLRWVFLALAATTIIPGCKQSAAPASEAPDKPAPSATLDANDPEACRPCHATVVEEFLTSMHAKSHHTTDPIFAGVRAIRMAKEGADIGQKCATCHSPSVPTRGLTCGTCHAVASVQPGVRGHKALTPAEPGLLLGPHDLTDSGARGPHQIGNAPAHMKDGRTLCLACHDSLPNAQKLPLCDTGAEHKALPAGSTQSCTSCHMPRVDGPSGAMASHKKDHASHRFLGAHHLWGGKGNNSSKSTFIAEHLGLTASLEGTTLSARLVNKTGHSFPTGFPGRLAIVTAEAKDAAGTKVWKGPGPGPATEAASHVMKKVYVDDQGKPTLAPYGVRIAVDTRLKPAETRVFSWTLPESAAQAQVSVVFRLLPPPLAKKLKLAGQRLAEPRTIITVQAVKASR